MWLLDLSIYIVVILAALYSISQTFTANSLPGYDWLVTTLALVLLVLGVSWGFALLIYLRKTLNKDKP